MIRYVVKNERGEYLRQYLRQNVRDAFGWTSKRSKRFVWLSKPRAHDRANEYGGKVYRLRRTSPRIERSKAVGYLRALAGTTMFLQARSALITAAGGIERGEHMAWRAPKETE